MRMFLVLDNTAGDMNRLCNEQGLIDYANQAHFVKGSDNFEEEVFGDDYIEPCTDVKNAIAILNTDMFRVEEIEVEGSFSFDLSTVGLSQPDNEI